MKFVKLKKKKLWKSSLECNLNLKIPKHLAIILDGNGRWATKKGLPRTFGHKAGIEAVKSTVENAKEIGIKVLSFFAFSTENWKRDKLEVDAIFDILRNYIKDNENEYLSKNIKLVTMGDLTKLPNDLFCKFEELKEKTKANDGLIVNIGLNYGGRDELARAFNQMIKDGKKSVTANDIKEYLYTSDLPDPDFIIRTSGEQRLSNFMLYQCAYSEFYFPKVLWPDFNKKHLMKAIKVYSKRDRRFGGINKEKK